MHSFNYDEQSNKLQQQQQQQQILFHQDYTLESVTADNNNNNLDPPTSPIDVVHKENEEELRMNEKQVIIYPTTNGTEHFDGNHIEYEKTSYENSPATIYFNKINNKDNIPTKFYTTLPSREAAEKLAALAAAGNVNSQLIGQLLRKQQKEKLENNDQTELPSNHKNDDNNESNQQQKHRRQHYNSNNKIQNSKKPSLQITVSDEDDDYTNDDKENNNVRKDSIVDTEYEYENEDVRISDSSISFDGKMPHDDDNNNNYQLEFGSRLPSKTSK